MKNNYPKYGNKASKMVAKVAAYLMKLGAEYLMYSSLKKIEPLENELDEDSQWLLSTFMKQNLYSSHKEVIRAALEALFEKQMNDEAKTWDKESQTENYPITNTTSNTNSTPYIVTLPIDKTTTEFTYHSRYDVVIDENKK